ncbi:MAG: radical SAM (seleno)protein TrsS [Suipraeoptans sp.]
MVLTLMSKDELYKTQSLCPVCMKKIPASYVAREDEVWLVKDCDLHGHFESYIWNGVQNFLEWNKQGIDQKPHNPVKSKVLGCPFDCGLCENHAQATCCVLFEVTNRCNLHCPVCFAQSSTDDDTGNNNDPNIGTIKSWYQMLLDRGGPFNIQLSGGEPTLREDLDEIIKLGKDMGFTFFQLNTNGIRIGEDFDYLNRLKKAGLSTVFLQFDSTYADAFVTLRGRDLTIEKEAAIANCERAGVSVVLVPTIKRGVNEHHIGEILNYAKNHMNTVRGVHFQPMSYFGRYTDAPEEKAHITLSELMNEIETSMFGKLKAVDFKGASAEHSLCSFNADYIVDEDGWHLIKKSQGDCCGNANTSDNARDVVARKWGQKENMDTGNELGTGFDLSALDEFLSRRNNTLAISAMAFQDVWNVDLNRLRKCHINIVGKDGELKPFCAYNITSGDGKSLHRRDIANKDNRCRALRELTGGTMRPGGLTLTEELVTECNLMPGDFLLDIGSGAGESVEYLHSRLELNVMGIDSDAVSEKPFIYKMDASKIDFEDSKFNMILSECNFSHLIENNEGVVAEIKRVLKPGGYIGISDMYLRGDSLEEGTQKVRDILERNNFEVIKTEDKSKYLSDLLFAIIMTYGSLDEFLRINCGDCRKCNLHKFIGEEKPGYYTMIALHHKE